jgi:hypothetical protein
MISRMLGAQKGIFYRYVLNNEAQEGSLLLRSDQKRLHP